MVSCAEWCMLLNNKLKGNVQLGEDDGEGWGLGKWISRVDIRKYRD